MALILASASPRRKELMELITSDFEIRTSEVDERALEESLKGLPPERIACELARSKARAVRSSLCTEDDIVIGADTSVVLGNTILGKPKDRQDALDMLLSLSGKTHEVITGVCLIKGDDETVFAETTKVEFMPLDDYQKEIITRYVDSPEPYDKAGAYGIQGGGALLVKGIEGDYFNVVGLPVAGIARALNLYI